MRSESGGRHHPRLNIVLHTASEQVPRGKVAKNSEKECNESPKPPSELKGTKVVDRVPLSAPRGSRWEGHACGGVRSAFVVAPRRVHPMHPMYEIDFVPPVLKHGPRSLTHVRVEGVRRSPEAEEGLPGTILCPPRNEGKGPRGPVSPTDHPAGFGAATSHRCQQLTAEIEHER